MSIFILGSVFAGTGTGIMGAYLGYQGEQRIRNVYGRVQKEVREPSGERPEGRVFINLNKPRLGLKQMRIRLEQMDIKSDGAKLVLKNACACLKQVSKDKEQIRNRVFQIREDLNRDGVDLGGIRSNLLQILTELEKTFVDKSKVPMPRNGTSLMNGIISTMNISEKIPEGVLGATVGAMTSFLLVPWYVRSSFFSDSSLGNKRGGFERAIGGCRRKLDHCSQTSLERREWFSSIEERNKEIRKFIDEKGTFKRGPLRFIGGYIADITEQFIQNVIDHVYERFLVRDNAGLISMGDSFCKSLSLNFMNPEKGRPESIEKSSDELCLNIVKKCRPICNFLSWGHSFFLIGPVLKWIDDQIDAFIAYLLVGKVSKIFSKKLTLYIEEFLQEENMRSVILQGMEKVISVAQDREAPPNPKADQLEIERLERSIKECLDKTYKKLEVPEILPLLDREEVKRELSYFAANEVLKALYLGEDIEIERKIRAFFLGLRKEGVEKKPLISREEFHRRLEEGFATLKEDLFSFVVLGNREKDQEAFTKEKGGIATGLIECVESLEKNSQNSSIPLIARLREEVAIINRFLALLEGLPFKIKDLPGEEVLLEKGRAIAENLSAQVGIIELLQKRFIGAKFRKEAYEEVTSILVKKEEDFAPEKLASLIEVLFPGDREILEEVRLFLEAPVREKDGRRGEALQNIKVKYEGRVSVADLERKKERLLYDLNEMAKDKELFKYERKEPSAIQDALLKKVASSIGNRGMQVIAEGEREILYRNMTGLITDASFQRTLVFAALEAFRKRI